MQDLWKRCEIYHEHRSLTSKRGSWEPIIWQNEDSTNEQEEQEIDCKAKFEAFEESMLVEACLGVSKEREVEPTIHTHQEDFNEQTNLEKPIVKHDTEKISIEDFISYLSNNFFTCITSELAIGAISATFMFITRANK